MIRAGFALLACACVALAACGDGREPVRPIDPLPRTTFGINAQALQRLPTVEMLDELELHLDSVEELGVDFVRTNLDWRIIEPRPPDRGRHAYEWATTDEWVAALAARGLRWQPTVLGSPTPLWAADPRALADCGSDAPPRRPSDYAALLGALARRYGPEGGFWAAHPELEPRPIAAYEIWNEPNLSLFWCPRPDPTAHARLYVAAHDAVHEVQSDATVVYGGLAAFQLPSAGSGVEAMTAAGFLRRAVRSVAGLRRRIDAVAAHPYRATPKAIAAAVVNFRATLRRLGLGRVPISVNEIGWVTSGRDAGPTAPEQERAELLPTAVIAIAASGCGVEAIAPHTWITAELDPANPEHWYGIADPATADAYPTAEAYANVVADLVGGEAEAPEAPRCE